MNLDFGMQETAQKSRNSNGFLHLTYILDHGSPCHHILSFFRNVILHEVYCAFPHSGILLQEKKSYHLKCPYSSSFSFYPSTFPLPPFSLPPAALWSQTPSYSSMLPTNIVIINANDDTTTPLLISPCHCPKPHQHCHCLHPSSQPQSPSTPTPHHRHVITATDADNTIFTSPCCITVGLLWEIYTQKSHP